MTVYYPFSTVDGQRVNHELLPIGENFVCLYTFNINLSTIG